MMMMLNDGFSRALSRGCVQMRVYSKVLPVHFFAVTSVQHQIRSNRRVWDISSAINKRVFEKKEVTCCVVWSLVYILHALYASSSCKYHAKKQVVYFSNAEDVLYADR